MLNIITQHRCKEYCFFLSQSGNRSEHRIFTPIIIILIPLIEESLREIASDFFTKLIVEKPRKSSYRLYHVLSTHK